MLKATANKLFGYGAGDPYDQIRAKLIHEQIRDKMKKRFENSGMPSDQMHFDYR